MIITWRYISFVTMIVASTLSEVGVFDHDVSWIWLTTLQKRIGNVMMTLFFVWNESWKCILVYLLQNRYSSDCVVYFTYHPFRSMFLTAAYFCWTLSSEYSCRYWAVPWKWSASPVTCKHSQLAVVTLESTIRALPLCRTIDYISGGNKVLVSVR